MYIVFEGTDGSGKSTTIEVVDELLRAKGYNVLVVAEPEKSEFGMEMRKEICSTDLTESPDKLKYVIKLFATIRQKTMQAITEHLKVKNSVVLSDRSVITSYIYQIMYALDELGKKEVDKKNTTEEVFESLFGGILGYGARELFEAMHLETLIPSWVFVFDKIASADGQDGSGSYDNYDQSGGINLHYAKFIMKPKMRDVLCCTNANRKIREPQFARVLADTVDRRAEGIISTLNTNPLVASYPVMLV